MKKFVFFVAAFLIISSFPISNSMGIRYKDKIFWRVDVTKDVIYGSNYENGSLVKLKMDVYEPHGDRASKRALVICIHGGGFVGGDKSNRHMVYICKDLARRGYITASINYRLQPKNNVDFEKAITAAMYDAKAAIRYFRRYAEKWRVDENKIALLGSSAGAVTALHACYLRGAKYEGDSGNPGYSSNVSACVDLWGGLFKNVTAIDSGEPPVLIIHGTNDSVVPFSEAINITKRCDEVGVYYEIYPLKGAGHAPWNKMNEFLPHIINFLYKKMIKAYSYETIQNNVEIEFVSGFGIKIAAHNYNEYPIYNFALQKIEIVGIMVFGLTPGVTSVDEIPAGGTAYLSFLVLGMGMAYITAGICYEEEGKIIKKDIYCEDLVIGPFVMVITQW